MTIFSPERQPSQRQSFERQPRAVAASLPNQRRVGLIVFGIVMAVVLLTLLASEWLSGSATAKRPPIGSGAGMTAAAEAFLKTLNEEQLETTVYEYDSEQRVGWHFIPKDERKGLQVKHMSETQREAAMMLLKKSLSEIGYDKATKIMTLESILAELEKGRQGGNIRDPERYYFTIFGEVAADERWGLSIEGHHLSLNFVVEGDRVVSSTPTFFATNPAIVKQPVLDFAAGLRVLDKEESLAFELVQSLSDEQREEAIIAEKAFREIRAAGEPQAPEAEGQGIAYDSLNDDQQALMKELIKAYADSVPADVAQQRFIDLDRAGGLETLKFAWAGADRPGVGHYYRIEGPTMLIEFVNTQPDAAGNPANHIHCVWRDPRGDFAIPADASE